MQNASIDIKIPPCPEARFSFSSMDAEGEQAYLQKKKKERKKGANEGTGGREIEESNRPHALQTPSERTPVQDRLNVILFRFVL